MADIDVCIASYRDSELVPTIRSAWDNSSDPSKLHFTVVSQDEDDKHPDLSFIPPEQLTYHKFHWSQSKGACWAREIGSRDINGTFFLQIDSHSRFRPNWDKSIIDSYLDSYAHHGKIVFTACPEAYKVKDDGQDEFYYRDPLLKPIVVWNESEQMVCFFNEAGTAFQDASSSPYGDEIYSLSANSIFCFKEIIEEVPYDSLLYFYGEEPSLALRLYTRGIKIINTPINFMFHEYKGSWGEGPPKRNSHWDDDSEWYILNGQSYERLAKILTGDMSLGIYGIADYDLYLQWIEKTGVELRDKYDLIMSKAR